MFALVERSLSLDSINHSEERSRDFPCCFHILHTVKYERKREEDGGLDSVPCCIIESNSISVVVWEQPVIRLEGKEQ